jgi:hypothetical protein
MATSPWGRAEKMTVLYLAKTGHVLGAATRLGAAGTPVDALSLAGEAMPVEGRSPMPANDLVVTAVSPSLLAAKEVAFDLGALREPIKYVVEDESVVLPSEDVEASIVPGTPGKIHVKLPVTFNKDIDYVVRVESAALDGPFERAGRAPAQNLDYFEVALPRSVGAGDGDFFIAAAVAGYQLSFAKDPV